MQRVRMVALGWQQPLVLERAEPPTASGACVVVEVEACGVCHRDLIDRGGGLPFLRVPVTPGHEAVGRVLAVGPQVTRWRVGDRVATLHRDACGSCAACQAGETSLCAGAAFVLGVLADGGYATHLMLPESGLYAVPDALPAAEAAVLLCTYGTAYRGLRAGLGSAAAAGRTVLVTGAAGGVGSAAVELATRLGARVVAVTREGGHAAELTALGAHRVLPAHEFHKHRDAAGVDVVLDCVGQATLNSSLRCLRLGGTAIAIGNLTPERLALNVGLVITRALCIIGSSGATARDMAAVLAVRGDRPFAIALERVPLEAAEAAQRRLRAGGVVGRIVLQPTRPAAGP